MSEFLFYLQQGIGHITDLHGFDHMVFVMTLCAVFPIDKWRRVAVLITAFTIGHSATLVLSSLNVIAINAKLVETLIPVTILLTSFYNVSPWRRSDTNVGYNYLLAMVFGLIHGMGFSNFFKSMMMGLSAESMLMPLFSFNIGIEIGQIFIVAIFFGLLWAMTAFFSTSHQKWNLYVSGAGGGIAISMIINAMIGA